MNIAKEYPWMDRFCNDWITITTKLYSPNKCGEDKYIVEYARKAGMAENDIPKFIRWQTYLVDALDMIFEVASDLMDGIYIESTHTRQIRYALMECKDINAFYRYLVTDVVKLMDNIAMEYDDEMYVNDKKEIDEEYPFMLFVARDFWKAITGKPLV